MSRRTRAERREAQPDPRFESTTVTKFVNALMLDGKKSLAEKIFYDALDIAEEKTGQPGLNVFRTALTNSKPALEVKSRRVGGRTGGSARSRPRSGDPRGCGVVRCRSGPRVHA